MLDRAVLSLLLIAGLVGRANAQRDFSPHSAKMIGVAPNVYLEVLDWGGSGPPIVLLAGAGNTAHDYDEFAPKLAAFGRVYGITRRGLGASSHPDSGYDADQLGNDILAVIDSLGLARPILIGHSFAGEELSSIGSRRPDRVGGLVYLDAGYSYAFYDTTRGNAGLELADIRRKIDRVQSGPVANYEELSALLREMATVDLPRLERSLRTYANTVDSAGPRSMLPRAMPPSVSQKLQAGTRMFTHIDAPVLAIYAAPHRELPLEAKRADSIGVVALAEGFRRVVPSARIVILNDANHLIWRSNESDVLREIHAFVQSAMNAPRR